MSKAVTSFVLIAVFSGLLMALSLAVARHGYPFGLVGVRRLDAIASAQNFLPLAAIYFFSAMLMMILPLKAASIVLVNAADALMWTAIALLAAIIGSVLARWAFGQSSILNTLGDWRFLFAVAIVGCHLALNSLRRNVLLRSLAFSGFAALTLCCLFWNFMLR
ncbi:hypothetical protein HNR59_000087 [Aquamicrobium lusatiense]|uniref:Uncharacterized protein n=1 Tax=Aquamicrobium lusatiense TaxID=89772 RepID=A0A7W9VU89_9HYPH|nr:hypothetical protein [Aquamicrobium lusatiense]MBB6010742.1 hypothetical protein [Aquamicrobium lusatiense]